MGTTADKLLQLQNTKESIKDAIIAKGVNVPSDTRFRDYATKIADISGGAATGGETVSNTIEPWVRPAEWLPLPDNIDGVQKVSILKTVFDTDSEYLAMIFEGDYTVDWGDGTVEDFTSGVKAEHKYDYSNPSLNSDTVAKFSYKQCVITITPQLGNDLTVINLNTKHSVLDLANSKGIETGFLDLRINSLNCSSLILGTDSSSLNLFCMLEYCSIGELGCTSLANLFYNFYSLNEVNIKDTINVLDFSKMHYINRALKKYPNYKFNPSGVYVFSMFNQCNALVEANIGKITPSEHTAFEQMFMSCRTLSSVTMEIASDIDYSLAMLFSSCVNLRQHNLTFSGIGKITSLSSTFALNYHIVESPELDTSACTIFNSTFDNCLSLEKLKTYDYSSAVSMFKYISNCALLKSAGYFNTSNALSSLSNFCAYTTILTVAPVFENTENVTNVSSMLRGSGIGYIPDYDFPSASSPSDFAAYCPSLHSVGSINFGSTTSSSNTFSYSFSLKRMIAPLKFTFSIADAKMSAAALNEMFTILPVVTGQTVTITGNHGASDPACDRSIATAKGWTVVG